MTEKYLLKTRPAPADTLGVSLGDKTGSLACILHTCSISSHLVPCTADPAWAHTTRKPHEHHLQTREGMISKWPASCEAKYWLHDGWDKMQQWKDLKHSKYTASTFLRMQTWKLSPEDTVCSESQPDPALPPLAAHRAQKHEWTKAIWTLFCLFRSDDSSSLRSP